MSRESGLACYWRGDSPIAPAPSMWRTANLVAKRALDIIFAGAALVALSPLFLIIAIAIKASDSGTVFFRQVRIGKDGKPFWIFKFRSMYADREDASGVAQTVAGDDRVMPIGAVLRRTSIDELPQLINVILGDMSLVGPRPHVAGQRAAFLPYEQVVPYYKLRHEMRPGLTGWAQANGFRGPTDDAVRARARIDHDMAYIQNFTIGLDIRILVRTLLREFFNGSGF
jgi:lipopolysaccharide/colanic/teichoic acid biosynthesis glycosyltransferase